jgi:hypothetical protein
VLFEETVGRAIDHNILVDGIYKSLPYKLLSLFNSIPTVSSVLLRHTTSLAIYVQQQQQQVSTGGPFFFHLFVLLMSVCVGDVGALR